MGNTENSLHRDADVGTGPPDAVVKSTLFATDRLRSTIKAVLPKASIILVGSHHYGEAQPDSDYDLLVLTYLPVRNTTRQTIAARLAPGNIKYDIHFIPRLMIHLRWKYVAGLDLDTMERIHLRLSAGNRSTIFANRVKMAYYYYVTGQYERSVLSLLRAKFLTHARTDQDIFSFAGNMALVERVRSSLREEEYRLFMQPLGHRINGTSAPIDTGLLLNLLNATFLDGRERLFKFHHNVRYYVYALKKKTGRFWVNYNKAITSALYYYAVGDLEASTAQLSRLTGVTDLKRQLEEYALLSVLEINN